MQPRVGQVPVRAKVCATEQDANASEAATATVRTPTILERAGRCLRLERRGESTQKEIS